MDYDVCDGYGKYIPKTDSSKFSTSFREHLKNVSDKVRDWPEWKKKCIPKWDSESGNTN